MYLVPYVACGLMFALALMLAVRTKSSTEPNTAAGRIARAVLTLLLLGAVGTVWYYSDVKHLENETVQNWVRIVVCVLFVGVLPEIWLDGRKDNG